MLRKRAAAFGLVLAVVLLVPLLALADDEEPENGGEPDAGVVELADGEGSADVGPDGVASDSSGDSGSDGGGVYPHSVELTEEQFAALLARLDVWGLVFVGMLMAGFGVSVGVGLGRNYL